jgi:uncharacterized protein (DUF433 family)
LVVPVAGSVVTLRGVHASAPVFAGTRIRVSTVQDYLQHGYGTDAILEAFPDLKAADVEKARRGPHADMREDVIRS